MSKHGWLTPDSIPEATTCRSLLIPDDLEILACVSGALLPLTKAYNWEKFGIIEPEEIAAAMQVMYFAWLEDACASGGEIPAPFWDDPDADDSEMELPAEDQPWYEELSHWIIAGFLAFTFTPAAGVFYITTIRAARIAFRARDYGAVAEILIDGVLHDTVDTFSATDSVIYYDLNIPVAGGFSASAFDPVTVEIRHSGEHNEDATPTADGYAIEIIRDYFGRDDSGAPVTRINPDTGEFERSVDGGATWLPNPEADPRNQVTFPALTGTDIPCRAAASAVYLIESKMSEWLTQVATGSAVLSAAWLLIGLLTSWFGGFALSAVATFLSTAVLDAGVLTVDAALTSTVYDKLRCILATLLDAEGRMPQANMPRLYQAIYAEIGGLAAQVLDLFFDFIGAGGISNLAAQDADPSPACDCCLDYADAMDTEIGWRTQITRWLEYTNVVNPDGTYQSSGGNLGTNGWILHNTRDAARLIGVVVDLGQDCSITGISYYHRRSTTAFTYRQIKRIYTEAGVLAYNNASGYGGSPANTWQLNGQTGSPIGVGRYVVIGFDGGTAGAGATMGITSISVDIT